MERVSRNALLAIALVISSGCGQAGSGLPSQSPPPGDGQSATAAPAQESCGETADKVTQHARQPEIRSVTMQGQCTLVSIETTLGDGESSTAKKICDSAAEVAYSGDTNSISVQGRSGKELSVGIAGAKCLAQP
ncbi:hypothetical protein GCM10010404_02320 [Nonomuraea africana]|uniref:DUF3617 family protein n=1 Tax=Nonomuraea africana TaxID=46171 RepID=A0ABR9KBJ3_9ACTN|nr:hypothetical protein [Nonomuraea africana]MBE1559386.1 hypothetical protein [Nonomuraea africana]